jgi:hypothetical protein
MKASSPVRYERDGSMTSYEAHRRSYTDTPREVLIPLRIV